MAVDLCTCLPAGGLLQQVQGRLEEAKLRHNQAEIDSLINFFNLLNEPFPIESLAKTSCL